MSFSLPKTAGIVAAILCIACMFGQPAVSRPAGAASKPASSAKDQVTALLVQRRDLLRQMERLYLAQYQGGQGNLQDLDRATKEAILADLDLPHSRAERIALRQEWADKTAQFEKLAEQRNKVGAALQTEVYEARIAHVDAEIDLAREKSGRAGR